MRETSVPVTNPLRVLRCAHCGRLDPGPRELCPSCFSADLVPHDVDGRGSLVSWTLVRRPPHRFMAEGPYAVCIVDLDARVRVTGRLKQLPDETAALASVPKLGACMRFAGARNGIALFEPVLQDL